MIHGGESLETHLWRLTNTICIFDNIIYRATNKLGESKSKETKKLELKIQLAWTCTLHLSAKLYWFYRRRDVEKFSNANWQQG